MLALAVPLVPEKVESWKAWSAELQGSKKQEFENFNHRMELTGHRAWLMESPQGHLVIVVHEGPGSGTMLEKLATSTHSFDTWFRERISEHHGADFSRPEEFPMPRNFIDWSTGQTTRIAEA